MASTPKKGPNIVVIGSCNIDLISYTPRLPRIGETIQGTRFVTGFGGKGANQAVAAARLGAQVSIVGKIGDDHFGHDYKDHLEKNSVNCEHLSIARDTCTGVAPITVDETGQNSIIIVSGANLLLSSDDVRKADGLIKRASVVVCGFEANLDATLEALQLARAYEVTTILNAAPAIANVKTDFYNLATIFCVNETEAEITTGMSVITLEDTQKAIAKMMGMGCHTVIITLGDRGAVYATREKPTQEHISIIPVAAVDTTGAGDSFLGALAYYVAYYPNLPRFEQIRRSCEIAAVSVQKTGTQTSFPWRKELMADLFI